MKAKLEFDLPEEKDDFKMATKGPDYYFTLWALDQEIRNILKYNKFPSDKVKTPGDMAEHIRDVLYQIMEDRNLIFNEIS